MFLADQWLDYEVLDCGGGEKLERWGDIILRRPDPQAIWPARVNAQGARGELAELPVELEDVMEQLSLCNILYAQAAATGSRAALREALEVDPAYAGIDLLYAEGVLSDMMEAQKERLKRFF